MVGYQVLFLGVAVDNLNAFSSALLKRWVEEGLERAFIDDVLGDGSRANPRIEPRGTHL